VPPLPDVAPVTPMRLMQILFSLRDNRASACSFIVRQAARRAVRDVRRRNRLHTLAGERAMDQGARTKSDDIVVVEVMVEKPDAYWWRSLRHKLEEDFRQDTVIVHQDQGH